jgi:hypothetical protein
MICREVSSSVRDVGNHSRLAKISVDSPRPGL